MSDVVESTPERTVMITQDQVKALDAAVLKACTDLRRAGYEPDRIETDWPSCRVLGRLDRFVRGHGYDVICGFKVEQHDDPGIRAVGRRFDTFKTITLELWP